MSASGTGKNKKQQKLVKRKMLASICVVYGIGVLLIIHFALVSRENPQNSFSQNLSMGLQDFLRRPLAIFPFPASAAGILVLFTFLFALVVWISYTTREQKKHYDLNKAAGDAEWMSDLDAYNVKYSDPIGKTSHDGPNNFILSQDLRLAMDNEKTNKNLNFAIFGGSGAGKTFNFIGPNILQANCSMIITDPSGELFARYARFLEYKGYKIKCFNLNQMELSNHYNPFHYIHSDQDVSVLVNTFMQNTVTDGGKSGDQFWEDCTRQLLTAVVDYLYHFGTIQEQTFTNVATLVREGKVDENNTSKASPLDGMFDKIRNDPRGEFAVKQYDDFKLGAGKTLASILISTVTRLQKFDLDTVARLTSTDDIDLDSIGDEKTALFVIIPTGDTTFSFLSAMMYSQLFQQLYHYSENTAQFSQCIMDSDKQIWKTFRAESKEELADTRKVAECYYERAKNGRIVENKEFGWWEIRTDRNELVGYRGSEKEAQEAFEKLKAGKVISNSEQSHGGQRVPIHVRFLLDEFPNTGRIPNFVQTISTVRKYDLSISMVNQSLTQLKNLYKDDWEAITACCDNIIFMGTGADNTTTEWLTKLLGKENRTVMNISYNNSGTSESFQRQGVELFSMSQLRTLPPDSCLVIPSRMDAYIGNKYKATSHPNWKLMQELNAKYGSYHYDPAKIIALLKAKKTSLEKIKEKHGDILPRAKAEEDKQNAQRSAAANSQASPSDPPIGKPHPVTPELPDFGEAATIPLDRGQEEEGEIQQTLKENERIWSVDDMIVTSAPGQQV